MIFVMCLDLICKYTVICMHVIACAKFSYLLRFTFVNTLNKDFQIGKGMYDTARKNYVISIKKYILKISSQSQIHEEKSIKAGKIKRYQSNNVIENDY